MSRRMAAHIVFKHNKMESGKEDFEKIDEEIVEALLRTDLAVKGIVIEYTMPEGDE